MIGIRSGLMDFSTDIFSLDRPSKVTFNLVGSKLPNSTIQDFLKVCGLSQMLQKKMLQLLQ